MSYSNDMANVLPRSKQLAVIGALVEGCSIRSTERMLGVHRDTVMRLGARVGEGCAYLLDEMMRDLPCERLVTAARRRVLARQHGEEHRHMRERQGVSSSGSSAARSAGEGS